MATRDWKGTPASCRSRPPLLQAYHVFHTVTKKNILKKVTLVKNKLFCQVSPSKNSSLHRTRIAAPNPLTKKSMLYPKTSGYLDLGVLVHLGVHTPAALIVTPDFASVGVRTWDASTVL